MKPYIESEALEHEIKLRQMGGEVTFITSKMCFVAFKVGGIDIEYSYNINTKGQVFLERIKPYPLPISAYDDEEHVIDVIRVDLEQFESASRSKNIKNFVEVNKLFHQTLKRFEDLFLYYNVPAAVIETVKKDLEKINTDITECKECTVRVYHDKDPDNL